MSVCFNDVQPSHANDSELTKILNENKKKIPKSATLQKLTDIMLNMQRHGVATTCYHFRDLCVAQMKQKHSI